MGTFKRNQSLLNKRWSFVRVHLHGNMKGTFKRKWSLSNKGWSFVRGSFAWKYEENILEKQRAVSLQGGLSSGVPLSL